MSQSLLDSKKAVGFTCSHCHSWNFLFDGGTVDDKISQELLNNARGMIVRGVCNYCDVPDAPTTDEIDHITTEERSKLVGYCETDDHFTHFTLGKSKGTCEKCDGKFSDWIGFQLQTQRTFDASLAKKKKRIKKK